MSETTQERRSRITREFKNRIAMAMIKYHNLPEKTPKEYYTKCKELKAKVKGE